MKPVTLRSLILLVFLALPFTYGGCGGGGSSSTHSGNELEYISPGLTYEEKQAKVEHLLMSRSGVYHEAAAEAQIMIDT